MSEILCKLCLKYPICAQKDEIKCRDLVTWLMTPDIGTDEFAERLSYFEKWWGREASVISMDTVSMYFKKKKDNYQCMIVKNQLP